MCLSTAIFGHPMIHARSALIYAWIVVGTCFLFLKIQRTNFQFMSNGVFLSLFHGDRGGEGSFHLLRVRGGIVWSRFSFSGDLSCGWQLHSYTYGHSPRGGQVRIQNHAVESIYFMRLSIPKHSMDLSKNEVCGHVSLKSITYVRLKQQSDGACEHRRVVS